jgi:hypothetical protein
MVVESGMRPSRIVRVRILVAWVPGVWRAVCGGKFENLAGTSHTPPATRLCQENNLPDHGEYEPNNRSLMQRQRSRPLKLPSLPR